MMKRKGASATCLESENTLASFGQYCAVAFLCVLHLLSVVDGHVADGWIAIP